MLTEGLNLDNICAKTRVIGKFMSWETSRKTESCETKTEIELQYERCFREMFIFLPISTASEIKVTIGWIYRPTRNYLFMAT